MVAQAIDRSKYELEIVHLFNVPEAEQSKLGSYANYGSNFKRLRASPCHPEGNEGSEPSPTNHARPES